MGAATGGMASLTQGFRSWLFGRGDDVGPLILNQRRIYILPTRVGLLFAAACAAMLAGAINYDLALGYALVFLLCGTGVAAILHTFRNLYGLGVQALPASPVFAGDTAEFRLIIENPRREPRLGLVVDDQPGLQQIPALGAATLTLRREAATRGRLRLGRVTLATVYPMGIFRAWSYYRAPVSCLVYPRPREYPFPQWEHASGEQGHHYARGQDDFSGLRDFQPGDPIRHVAWKLVARRPDHPTLPVKEFSGGEGGALDLNWHALPNTLDGESKLEILCGWVLQAAAEGRRYGLTLPNRQISPNLGGTHQLICLEALALHGLDPSH